MITFCYVYFWTNLLTSVCTRLMNCDLYTPWTAGLSVSLIPCCKFTYTAKGNEIFKPGVRCRVRLCVLGQVSLSDCAEPRGAQIAEVTNEKRPRSEMNVNQPRGRKKLLVPTRAAWSNHVLINSCWFLLFTSLFKCSCLWKLHMFRFCDYVSHKWFPVTLFFAFLRTSVPHFAVHSFTFSEWH